VLAKKDQNTQDKDKVQTIRIMQAHEHSRLMLDGITFQLYTPPKKTDKTVIFRILPHDQEHLRQIQSNGNSVILEVATTTEIGSIHNMSLQPPFESTINTSSPSSTPLPPFINNEGKLFRFFLSSKETNNFSAGDYYINIKCSENTWMLMTVGIRINFKDIAV